MLRRRPALRFALLLGGGILLADALPVSFWLAFSFLAFSLILAAFSLFFSARGLFPLVAYHLVVTTLGFTLANVHEADIRNRRVMPEFEEDLIRARGVLEELPVRQGNSLRMVIETDSIHRHGIPYSEKRRFLVLLNTKKFPQGLSVEVGQTLLVKGKVDDFPSLRNPGEFDYGRFLALSEIDGVLRASEISLVFPAGRSLSIRRWFNVLRSDLGEILEAHHGSEQASFLRGVLFGDRSDLPAELKESFLVTGTIHILAVSGSNVAVIALILFLTFGLFRLPRKAAVLLTVGGLVFYMMLTGASSSIVRATIMGSVLLGGKLLERPADVYNSISVAACVVLLWSPLQLFDVGFQLSFAAVLSIVYLYPKLDALLRQIPSRWEEIRALHAVWQVFAVSFAAQIGTLPFTAYYFERFSVVSLGANLIVVPLVALNLMIGCLTIAASLLSDGVASVYAAVNEVLSNILLGSVRVAASVPHASVETNAFTIESAVVYYLVLLGIFNMRHAPVVKAVVLSLLIILTARTYGHIVEACDHTLRITSLDIGQGDSHILEFPGGAVVVIDAGPSTPGFDSGKRIIAPYLRRIGVSTIDAIIITHPHADHDGGLPALLSEFEVREIIEAESSAKLRLQRHLDGRGRQQGVLIRVAGAGDEISPDRAVRLYVLHPLWNQDSVQSANNRSIALKLVYGSSTALFTGDAEEQAEELIRRRFGTFLDSEVLKLGHHGSKTSSTDRFLNSITPNFAIISVGRRNRFGHPSGEVVARMSSGRVEVARTDRDGAIVLESNGRLWKRIHWRKRAL